MAGLQGYIFPLQMRGFLLVEGSWSGWNVWGPCSTSCGQGSRSRSRGHSEGMPCFGSQTDSEICQGLPSKNILAFIV